LKSDERVPAHPPWQSIEVSTKLMLRNLGLKSEFYMIRNDDASCAEKPRNNDNDAVGTSGI
jgi:hypothetical protein